ncbi:MAG: Rossmann-like and DUF2520 domain-containing protein [Bacteroidota bacterium]
MRVKKKLPVTIIGAGAVGRPLALALWKKKYPIRIILSRNDRSAKIVGKSVHARHGRLLSAKNFRGDGIVFIAVPDDEIKNVVRILSRLCEDFSRSIVFHTSGALSSNLLSLLKVKGAAVGSFHPLQTFPKSDSTPERLHNIWIGIEGDKKAIATGKKIAHDVGARPFVLSSRQKVLYHIAAVFSSNYFVTLLSVVEELGKRIHLSKRETVSIFEPLILQSLQNVKEQSAASALTGPIARGDVQTLKRHRNELKKKGMKRIALLYSALARETSSLALRK